MKSVDGLITVHHFANVSNLKYIREKGEVTTLVFLEGQRTVTYTPERMANKRDLTRFVSKYIRWLKAAI